MKLQCFFKCILTIASSSLAAFLIATITKMIKSGAFAAFIIGRYPEFWNTPIDINLAWIGIATINLALHGLDLLYSPLIAKFFPSAPSWLFHIPYNAATPDWLSSFLTWHTDITPFDLIPFLNNPHDATSYRAYFQLFDYLNTGIGIALAFLTAGLLAGFLTFILIQDLPLAAAGWINWMRAQKAKAQLEALKTMLRKIQRRQLTYEDQDALDEAFTLIH